jgi:SAM-dependent methyltransferase
MTSRGWSASLATHEGELREQPALGFDFSLAGAPPAILTPSQLSARDSILHRDRLDEYESVACPCGSGLGDRLLAEVDRHGLPSRNVICLGCGLVRLTPRWRESRYRAFYHSEYRTLYNPSSVSRSAYAEAVAASSATRERAAWIEHAARRYGIEGTPRVLEIGAGAGWNLLRLPSAWRRVGYDVDEDYLEIGRESFGLDMRYGFVDEALAEVAQADVVILSHVLEHFSSPAGVLEQIGRELRPTALLLLEVPGIFRIHRTNLDVRSYLQNAHTFTYCAATLADECRRAGLVPLWVDETARAICRAGDATTGTTDQRPRLADRIIRYLRLCSSGYRRYARLRSLPLIGRYAAALWKRTFYAALALLVPNGQTPR